MLTLTEFLGKIERYEERDDMNQEKRRFSRITFQMKAELEVNNTTYAFDSITNLSVGGCLFELATEFPIGTDCQVLIVLNPADRRMNVRAAGRIVRSGGETVSVQFTAIEPESLHHLQNIIRYNASDPDVIEDEIKDHPGLV
jgi:hypothetical protein